MSRHMQRIAAGRELRDRLRAEGRTDDARILDELCRSSAMSAGLNKGLQRQLGEMIAAKEAGACRFTGPVLNECEVSPVDRAVPAFGPGRWA